jgi:hypothetical protein
MSGKQRERPMLVDFSPDIQRLPFYSRSRDAVIRVYDDTGNVIETHEHAVDFREWR